MLAGMADRSQSKDARSPVGERDRIAPDQRQAIAFARRFDSSEERKFPLSRAADGEREKSRRRRRALGRKVGQIDRDQLPPDARGRVGAEEMHALGNGVMSHD